MPATNRDHTYHYFLSPFRLVLLTVNATCFTIALTMMAIGRADAPVPLLATGTGLSTLAGLTAARLAARRTRN